MSIIFLFFYDLFFLVTNVTQFLNSTSPLTQPLDISAHFKIGFVSAYVVIFLISLFGNSLGLFVVLRKSSSRSATTLFIANMAVADLLLTLTVMPFSVFYMYRPFQWFGGILGTVTCKALFYIIPVSIAATVFTMVFISFDRFYAIFYPLKEKVFRKPKVLSALISSVSFLLMIPCVLMFQVTYMPSLDEYYCVQEWPYADPNDASFVETYRVLKLFHMIMFVLMYALPLLITTIVYALICRKLWLRKIPGNVSESNRVAAEKSKRRVVRLLVIICMMFALCWSPVYVNHYIWYVRPDLQHLLPTEVQLVFLWLAHANSAINPCLYVLLNDDFRRKLFSTLVC